MDTRSSAADYVRMAREWNHRAIQTRKMARDFTPGKSRDRMMFMAGESAGRAQAYLFAARDAAKRILPARLRRQMAEVAA